MSFLQKTLLTTTTGFLMFSTSTFAAQNHMNEYNPDESKAEMTLYRSGGVGNEGSDQMERLENTGLYNVKVTSAFDTGHYVSDVGILITDNDDTVMVDTKTRGPLLYVDLEPGSYQFVAEYKGMIKQQTITVKEAANMREIFLHWELDESVNG